LNIEHRTSNVEVDFRWRGGRYDDTAAIAVGALLYVSVERTFLRLRERRRNAGVAAEATIGVQ
jgi:hypothetical protein